MFVTVVRNTPGLIGFLITAAVLVLWIPSVRMLWLEWRGDRLQLQFGEEIKL